MKKYLKILLFILLLVLITIGFGLILSILPAPDISNPLLDDILGYSALAIIAITYFLMLYRLKKRIFS